MKRVSLSVTIAAAALAVIPFGPARADSGQTSGAALEKLQAVVNGDHRSAANKARDAHRHPVETLTFFGIRPDMTVVELWPFGGWYTEILAPYLSDSGVYYAAAMDPATASPQELGYNESLDALLSANSELFSKVRKSALGKGTTEIAPEGTADLVVSFRNVHNWVWADM